MTHFKIRKPCKKPAKTARLECKNCPIKENLNSESILLPLNESDIEFHCISMIDKFFFAVVKNPENHADIL
jgi:hypothetical protein